MTDYLEEIFRLQKEYHDIYIRDNIRYPSTRAERIDRLCTAMSHEVHELQDHTNWKWWKQPKPIQIEAAREELIDIIHFIVDAAIELDMTAEQFFIEYRKKNQINRQRQEQGY